MPTIPKPISRPPEKPPPSKALGIKFDLSVSRSVADMLYLSTVYMTYDLFEHRNVEGGDFLEYVENLVKGRKFIDMLFSIRASDAAFNLAVRVLPDLRFGAAEIGEGGEVRPLESIEGLRSILDKKFLRVSVYIKA